MGPSYPGHSTLLQSSEFILAYTRQTDLLYSTTLLYYYSLQDEAQLTLLGEVIARGHMEAWLVTRLRLIHAWATPNPNPNPNPTNPDSSDDSRAVEDGLVLERIERPVFIVGYARTGTTFLTNLLMQDPG